jgi:hypothetical protein
VNHASKDSHHGGTSLVEFLGAKLVLLFFRRVSKETNWDSGSAKVSREGTFVLLPETNLQHSNETDNLGNSGNRDGGDGSETSRDIGELRSGEINVTRKTSTSPSGQIPEESELSNTSVLNLNITKAIKSGLVAALKKAEGIKESKWRLNTKLVLESLEGGSLRSRLGRSEGSGRGQEGGKDSGLHLGSFNRGLTNVSLEIRHSSLQEKDTFPGFPLIHVGIVPNFYLQLKLTKNALYYNRFTSIPNDRSWFFNNPAANLPKTYNDF